MHTYSRLDVRFSLVVNIFLSLNFILQLGGNCTILPLYQKGFCGSVPQSCTRVSGLLELTTQAEQIMLWEIIFYGQHIWTVGERATLSC